VTAEEQIEDDGDPCDADQPEADVDTKTVTFQTVLVECEYDGIAGRVSWLTVRRRKKVHMAAFNDQSRIE